jgi:hypothetical protein
LVYSATVSQLKSLNSLLDDQSSDGLESTSMMINVLVCIITIIWNFLKLDLTVARIPHFFKTTKCIQSNSHLATVASSNPESKISDTLQQWKQKAIVLVMEAGGVLWLVGKATL